MSVQSLGWPISMTIYCVGLTIYTHRLTIKEIKMQRYLLVCGNIFLQYINCHLDFRWIFEMQIMNVLTPGNNYFWMKQNSWINEEKKTVADRKYYSVRPKSLSNRIERTVRVRASRTSHFDSHHCYQLYALFKRLTQKCIVYVWRYSPTDRRKKKNGRNNDKYQIRS